MVFETEKRQLRFSERKQLLANSGNEILLKNVSAAD